MGGRGELGESRAQIEHFQAGRIGRDLQRFNLRCGRARAAVDGLEPELQGLHAADGFVEGARGAPHDLLQREERGHLPDGRVEQPRCAIHQGHRTGGRAQVAFQRLDGAGALLHGGVKFAARQRATAREQVHRGANALDFGPDGVRIRPAERTECVGERLLRVLGGLGGFLLRLLNALVIAEDALRLRRGRSAHGCHRGLALCCGKRGGVRHVLVRRRQRLCDFDLGLDLGARGDEGVLQRLLRCGGVLGVAAGFRKSLARSIRFALQRAQLLGGPAHRGLGRLVRRIGLPLLGGGRLHRVGGLRQPHPVLGDAFFGLAHRSRHQLDDRPVLGHILLAAGQPRAVLVQRRARRRDGGLGLLVLDFEARELLPRCLRYRPVALQRVAERLALGLQLADAGRRRGELRLQAPEGVQALGLLAHARQHRIQFLERGRGEVARVGEALDVLAELVDRIRVGRRYLKG